MKPKVQLQCTKRDSAPESNLIAGDFQPKSLDGAFIHGLHFLKSV